MDFKERVLKLIAYYLQVAESKMISSKEQNRKGYYGAKVALLRDLYDDVKAMDLESEAKHGYKRNRTCK